MANSSVFSVCGMCTVRCPIKVDVENGQVAFIQGNPHVPAMKGAVCPRGAAGTALLHDNERPQTPLIREGNRGEGKWRKASWDEALDYVADKLKAVKEEHGARGIAFSDRGGPFRDFHRAFLKGLGTPNYNNHDSSCARNVQHAALSLTNMGRKAVSYDLKNCKHVVLQFRNIFEAVNVQEVNNLMDAMEKGCKMTVIDIRANISAAKASRFMLIKPGTDYAFNLAVIHELIAKRLYNRAFIDRYMEGFKDLEQFVAPYTPEWAQEETGIPAEQLRSFVEELAAAAPSVIWHPGWMAARYRDSFYICRSIYIINALLGAYGAKGGLPFVSKPGDVGAKGLKSFMDLYPKPEEKRADGVGWKYKHFEQGPGLAHLLYEAIETQDPYPVKAYIAYRHDPLMGYPEPERLQKKWDNLDLLVSVTFSWSDTAWYSDVVLPLSTYLERESIIATKNALKPQFFVRKRAVQPRYDSLADWEIISGLARRLDLPELVFDRVEDLWNFQLEGTGVSLSKILMKKAWSPFVTSPCTKTSRIISSRPIPVRSKSTPRSWKMQVFLPSSPTRLRHSPRQGSSASPSAAAPCIPRVIRRTTLCSTSRCLKTPSGSIPRLQPNSGLPTGIRWWWARTAIPNPSKPWSPTISIRMRSLSSTGSAIA